MANDCKLFCELCNIPLHKGVSEVDSHFFTPQHENSRSQILSPRYQVFVWWRYPLAMSSSDIMSLFLKHGPVTDICFHSGSSCFVTSSQPDFIQWLLETQPPIYFRGLLLGVWAVPVPFSAPKFPEQCLNPTQLQDALVSCPNIERQVDTFLRWAEIPPDEQDFQAWALKEIRDGISKFLPNSRITVVGSSSTGFQLPFSSLDLNLVLDTKIKEASWKANPIQHKENIKELMARRGRYFTIVQKGKRNALDVGKLMGEYQRTQLDVLEKVVKIYVRGACQSFVIPGARNVALKFSMENRLGIRIKVNEEMDIHNSKLTWFMGQLDPRVRPMVLLVQHWARIHRLVYSAGAMTGYAITWLVIYFLQNVVPPVLPTVKMCQKLDESSKPIIINGYNCSFCDDVKKYPPTKNVQTVETLFRNFFIFYKDIDFINSVICPYSGEMVDRQGFFYLVPGSKFDNTFIQIQDPFEHKRNLGHRTRPKFYANWTAQLKRAARVLRTTIRHDGRRRLYGLAEAFQPRDVPKGEFPKRIQEHKYELKLLTLCQADKLDGRREQFLTAAIRLIHRFLVEVLHGEISMAKNFLDWPNSNGQHHHEEDDEEEEEGEEEAGVAHQGNCKVEAQDGEICKVEVDEVQDSGTCNVEATEDASAQVKCEPQDGKVSDEQYREASNAQEASTMQDDKASVVREGETEQKEEAATEGNKRKLEQEENDGEPADKKKAVGESAPTPVEAPHRRRPVINKKKYITHLQTLRFKTDYLLWVNRPSTAESEEGLALLEKEKEISNTMLAGTDLEKKLSVFRLRFGNLENEKDCVIEFTAYSKREKDEAFELYLQDRIPKLLANLTP